MKIDQFCGNVYKTDLLVCIKSPELLVYECRLDITSSFGHPSSTFTKVFEAVVNLKM
jgi:hypothetical protein